MINKGKRASGILLHITSLPSSFGVGDLGPQSHQFVDLLAKLRQRYWSILPVNPTRVEYGNSPYKNDSAFAGNLLLISPEQLIEEGILSVEYTQKLSNEIASKVDYQAAETAKKSMLEEAYSNFKKRGEPTLGQLSFELFSSEESGWLEDYALYKALHEESSRPWYLWPKPLRDRIPSALARKAENLKEKVEEQKFRQYVFFSQWSNLKERCRTRELKIIGDMPFYVGYDSADVWAHPELFKLDKQKRPKYVGGVPPDYFSSAGQLWGDPVYDWKQICKAHFEWWISRIKHNLKLYDALRFDHFRGFIAYWQVPANLKTAKVGRWIRTPAESFFIKVQGAFPALPFIAEDLGTITPSVEEAVARLGLPGMRVLLFAFDGSPTNPHLPENYVENSVAYTGTHDNNTVKGWFTQEATPENKKQVADYVGQHVSADNVSTEFIKAVLASKSNLSIIPLQDALGLGAEARMNHPASQVGNWEWRATVEQMASKKLDELGELTVECSRF